MTSVSKMLKQAQKLQQQVEKTQNELAKTEISYSCNGVTVVALGDQSVKSISIPKDLLSQDTETVQDVILLAVNGALTSARKMNEERLSALTGGLTLPGMF